MITPRRLREEKSPRAAKVVAGALAAILLAGCAESQSDSPPAGRSADAVALPPLAARDPFGPGPASPEQLRAMGWKQVSIQDAAALMPKALSLPEAALANDSRVEGAWIQPDYGAIGVFYDSGLVLNIKRNEKPINASEFIEEQLATGAADQSRVQVGKTYEALAVQPDSSATGDTNPGSITFFVGPSTVVLAGIGLKPELLMESADAMVSPAG